WACRNRHCYQVEVTEGPYTGFQGEEAEFEIMAAFGSLIGQTDPGAALMLSNVCDRVGLEGNEAGWLIAWVMECYEKGLITGEQTGGLEMHWGNAEAVKAMLHKVARREGFGDVLAEGVRRACEHLGGEAERCGVYLKRGNTPRTYDPRALWHEILDEATSDSGYSESDNLHQEEFGLEFTDIFSPQQVPALAAALKGKRAFVDSLVVCFFCTGMFHKPMVKILNAVTGWDLSSEDAMRIGLRTHNLMRAFDVRAGITPEAETPSERLLDVVPDGPAKGKTIRPHWNEILDGYYQRMGWDRKTGKPLPQTLRGLGLDSVVPQLWGGIVPL
ncbi:MAG: aldehyde ferredoxin oxidoreductase C-terminal domain-containing protein, partial [Chloroflexota bacterium]|nr:aldehyde ferredoxin oxidoreductase C-terminal domain-containing protein [Chloroflexota bacterium]